MFSLWKGAIVETKDTDVELAALLDIMDLIPACNYILKL